MNFKIIYIVIKLLLLFFSALLFGQDQKLPPVKLNSGSGHFYMVGGVGHETDTITIYYHKPKTFSTKTRVLLVVPGAGRNGDDYRDAWTEISERYDVLVLSPSYPETKYPYANYHLGSTVKDVNIYKGITFKRNSNQVFMDENAIGFNVNNNTKEWIYNDFDRIFETVKLNLRLEQEQYDMFGHSAGGQVLHRFALLFPNSKANRILASNAGSYTVPDDNVSFPFGLKNIEISRTSLAKSFQKKLVVFLGEEDNENEKGGLLLRSTTVDKQGLHRLARGTYFYTKSTEFAKQHQYNSKWKLVTIPNVGHNQRKMAAAAAAYLYKL